MFALISALPLRAETVAAKLPDEQDRVVVVRTDDTRWVPADDQAARDSAPGQQPASGEPVVRAAAGQPGGQGGAARRAVRVGDRRRRRAPAGGRARRGRALVVSPQRPAGAIEELQLPRKPGEAAVARGRARAARLHHRRAEPARHRPRRRHRGGADRAWGQPHRRGRVRGRPPRAGAPTAQGRRRRQAVRGQDAARWRRRARCHERRSAVYTSADMPGTVVVETVDSRALAGNPLGDPTARRIAVWLPPSYAAEPDAPLPGHLLAGGLRGHRRDVVLGQPLAAGAGDAPGPRWSRAAGWARPSSSRPTGSRAGAARSTSTRPRSATTRPTSRARWCRRSTPASAPSPPRDARAIGGKSSGGFGALALAMRNPQLFSGRRQPRRRHVLRAVADPRSARRGAHAAPARRHRRLPRPLRGARRTPAQGRRRLHDDDGAGAGGRVFARAGRAARRRAAVRPRHRRDRLDRVAALEGVGSGRDAGASQPRRCAR